MRSLFLFSGAAALAVTPTEKVTQLLLKLEHKTQEEGKAEAAAYDKYACFCKEQADNKLYAITKDKASIKKLTARIEKLDADIDEHTQTIQTSEKDIAGLEGDSEQATSTRADERTDYVKKDKQYRTAIKACENAVTALKDTGATASDTAATATSLLQSTYALASAVESDSAAIAKFQDLINQAPAKFEYKSGEIIAVLQGLVATFKEKKKELFETEAAIKQTFNLEEQSRQHQIKVLTELVEDNKQSSAEKTSEREDKQATKDSTVNDKNADQAFLDDLTEQCEHKAQLFDQRSQSRAGELKALNEAIELLQGDGGGMYKANKKLNLAQQPVENDDFDSELAFVQTRRSSADKGITGTDKKIMELLSKKAKSLKSTILASFTVRLQADHFKKVRALIKDLVARLESEAASEATKMEECQEDMDREMKKRDDSKTAMEKLQGQIASLTNKIDECTERIADLSQKIADLKKGLKEQQELRDEDRKDNEQTISDSEAGRAAIEGAISSLQEYYGSFFLIQRPSTLIQVRAAQNPADRSGKTVGDLAPDTFDSEYGGNMDESKGIIGLLEVIHSDYERTIQKTNDEETEAQSAFDAFKTETEQDIDGKQQDKEDTKAEKSNAEDDKQTAEDDLESQTESNDNALKALDVLKASCVDTELSYEERVKRRKQEIAALKEALTILEEMGFLQKRAKPEQ